MTYESTKYAHATGGPFSTVNHKIVFKFRIPQPFHPILFVGDLSIHTYTCNLKRVHKLLQTTLASIVTWLSNFGFRISPSRSKLIIVEKQKSKIPSLPLPLNHILIPYTNLVEVLGLLFHSNHCWIHHIKYIKAKMLENAIMFSNVWPFTHRLQQRQTHSFILNSNPLNPRLWLSNL